MKPFLSVTLALASFAFLSAPLHAAPQWIWLSQKPADKEKVTFQKTFTIKGAVKNARLEFTCDNGAKILINGQPIATNEDWDKPIKMSVGKFLKAGENTILVEAKNEGGSAALVARLDITTSNNAKQVVETGPDWMASAAGASSSKPAVVIAEYGAPPWGNILDGKPGAPAVGVETSTNPNAISVPDGFKVELLYTVPKPTQGSWVGLTVDPKGRLLTSDQKGGLYRVSVPPIGTSDGAEVEKLDVPIKGAHGLLYAFDSLYAMVNEDTSRGLFRMKDDGKGNFGKPELIRKMDGGGEHGPHSAVVGPDGKSLFIASGNHTKLPDGIELSRAPMKGWSEDHLLPRMWDANGHAKGILAPGGYICKTDPEGKTFELYSAGFRNQFDIAFNTEGELFTFDSDMEWDIGSPWYRPTRIYHCVSGADFGWRSGSGKWPVHYPDALPGVLDVGPGSPTGVVIGTGAKFPAKYQRAFYAADWTYGTLYAIHLVPDGASFKTIKEEFATAKPLPLTDVIIHPKDGAMYFMIGGRGTQSALYRVSYVGNEPTSPAPAASLTPEAKLRRELEQLHTQGTGPDALPKSWPHLSHPDRFVRYAARVAIERQPSALWAEKAMAETNPQARIEALVALARMGDKSLQPKLVDALIQTGYEKLDPTLRLSLLRAFDLAFTRMGKPDAATCAQVAKHLDAHFPGSDPRATLDLAELLIFLDSPTIVAKLVPMMETARDHNLEIGESKLIARNDKYAAAVNSAEGSQPNRTAISYAFVLRNAKVGWTPELRKAFFAWFPRTAPWKGGNSFRGFLNNIRTESLTNFVPDAEKAALDELAKSAPPKPPADYVAPKGPGKNYSVADVVALAQNGLKGRSFANGKAMYQATLCLNCHKFAGDGGNIGPDLTGSGSRYTIKDLAENIIEPSKVISDQYDTQELTLKSGGVVIGRIVSEENGKLLVMTSALAPDSLSTVAIADVASRKTFNVSMMPPGLINSLNSDELLDLIAYMQSGGNPNDKAFAK